MMYEIISRAIDEVYVDSSSSSSCEIKRNFGAIFRNFLFVLLLSFFSFSFNAFRQFVNVDTSDADNGLVEQ